MKEFLHFKIIFLVLAVLLNCYNCKKYQTTENEMHRRFNSIGDIFRHFNSENEILKRFNSGNEIYRRFSAEVESAPFGQKEKSGSINGYAPRPFTLRGNDEENVFSARRQKPAHHLNSQSQIKNFREYISELQKSFRLKTELALAGAGNSKYGVGNGALIGDEISQRVNPNSEFRQREQDSLAKRYLELFSSSTKASISEGEFQSSNLTKTGLPDMILRKLEEISQVCPKNAFYNSYNPNHKTAVYAAAALYNDCKDFESMMEMSWLLKLREEIHPQVWYVSLRTAQLAKMPQTLEMERPHPIFLFPTRFFPDSVMKHVQGEDEECVILDEHIGEDNGVENKLWYFREDVQMNAHHWIWHLLFPINSTTQIDRRGEAFYFFHHEIMARYITERLGHGLEAPEPFNMQLDSIVEEAYYPHLQDGISTLHWAPRAPEQSLSAALNETVFEQLYNLTIKRDRILDSLLAGYVFSGSRLVPIHTTDNTNELGELTEASRHSINPDFYGQSGYHNQGHLILANLIGNSPSGSLGVMADEATALRDVIFYRWHRLLDMLFQAYKELHLAPYSLYDGEYPLVFPGVDLTHIQVIPEDGGTVNKLHTFWNTRRINLYGGLDFNTRNGTNATQLNICAKHLDHEEFNYHIKIVNRRKERMRATIRIYLAPRHKSSNGETRYTMEEQRTLFFSLDSFVTLLKPGSNVVIRSSLESTLTAPWPKSIRELRESINASIAGDSDALHCECGFPHHLLLPRGTEAGMTFDLFAMVTEAVVDEQVKPSPQPKLWRDPQKIPKCTPSHIQCGLPGKSYPDSKPMGFPFDRKTQSHGDRKRSVSTLEEFVGHVPNMVTTQILIIHENVQLDI